MNNSGMTGKASLILENGIVFPGKTPPEEGISVVISENRIMAVGPHQATDQFTSSHTERINLRGRSIIPGFIDSHTCFATDCRRKIDQIPLGEKPLPPEKLEERLYASRLNLEPEEWVVATGYAEDPSVGKPLQGEDLDRMVPDRPAVILSTARNLCVLNRPAMEELYPFTGGVDAEDVEAERGEGFKPNGRFHGKIDRMLPDGFPCFGLRSLKRKMQKLGKIFLQRGVTTIHDIDIFRSLDMAAYVSLRQENALPLRVVPFVRGFPRSDRLQQHCIETGMGTGFGDDWLRLGPMKFTVDGTIGSKSAAISCPWVGTPGRYGQMYLSEGQLVEKIRRVTEAGFQVAFHAIGDRAVGGVLQALHKARGVVSRPILRPRIHHCTLINPDQIQRMREIGAIPVGHSHFIRFMGDANLRSLGSDRIQAGYFPFRAFLDQGVPAVLSSEPILPLDRIHPMIGISAAITRKTLTGQVLAPDQRVSLEEALRMYTVHPAYAAFEEGQKGAIEPGKLADLAVLETDLRKVSPEDLADVKVDYTILNGKIVFARV